MEINANIIQLVVGDVVKVGIGEKSEKKGGDGRWTKTFTHISGRRRGAGRGRRIRGNVLGYIHAVAQGHPRVATSKKHSILTAVLNTACTHCVRTATTTLYKSMASAAAVFM